MDVVLSVVDGLTALTDVIKAANAAGCCGHYDGDFAKVVTIDGAEMNYRVTVLPSPGLLRFLAEKIEKL